MLIFYFNLDTKKRSSMAAVLVYYVFYSCN